MQSTPFFIEERCSQIAKQPCFPVELQSGDATKTVARIKSLCNLGGVDSANYVVTSITRLPACIIMLM